ncbi:uncharacterized protein MAM_08323 [Metarhizium album ARSEF 1941]|uniref:Uncharacterized protein n=1 Tax=Metarhizium album (strain ARSEF 1941) TaxID=1081103 RepID=A0A0B2WJI4_METAS|nr:uncharacterized protein MAM_08323 [Metarhizium album ARSEF 1941]KHN93844.1 hypothetical protein MAM_08323 [Metarhizium album ARSEF 1941]
MRLTGLVLGLLAASSTVLAVAAEPEYDSRTQESVRQYLDEYIRDLQEGFHLDPQNRPYKTHRMLTESTCIQSVAMCATTSFWLRDHMQIDNKTIIAISFDDEKVRQVVNFSPDVVYIQITETTSHLDGTTKGWTAGARLTAKGIKGTLGALGGFAPSLLVYGNYSSARSQQDEQTKSSSVGSSCRPGHVCDIIKVTFAATTKGNCKRTAHLECNGHEENVCGKGKTYGCSQRISYQQEQCRDADEAFPCTVTMPVQDASGRPLVKLLSISSKLRTGSSGDKASRLRAHARRGGADEDPIVEFIN